MTEESNLQNDQDLFLLGITWVFEKLGRKSRSKFGDIQKEKRSLQ